MIAFCSIYGDIFPATLDGGYSVGGGSPAIIVRGHDQNWVNRVYLRRILSNLGKSNNV